MDRIVNSKLYLVLVICVGICLYVDMTDVAISSEIIETEYTRLYFKQSLVEEYYIEVDGVAIQIDSDQYNKFLMSDDRSCVVEVSVMESRIFKTHRNNYRLIN